MKKIICIITGLFALSIVCYFLYNRQQPITQSIVVDDANVISLMGSASRSLFMPQLLQKQ